MVEIHLTDWIGDPSTAVPIAANSLGLSISSDGTLRSYPGSRHWHLKKLRSTGTLEITYWPERTQFWVTYHANRIGDGWVAGAAEKMADELVKLIGGARGPTVTHH